MTMASSAYCLIKNNKNSVNDNALTTDYIAKLKTLNMFNLG